jgi:hypothetical protein
MELIPELKRWKSYIDSKFKRSYGSSIVYEDKDDEIIFVSKGIRFYVEADGTHYNLTTLDIVYLLRYVRFLSILVAFLIFLIIGLMCFWS